MHRIRLSFVLRGHGPEALDARAEAALVDKLSSERHGRDEARRRFAAAWWCEELMLHDWMPNEQTIQFRGPYWAVMHESHYTAICTARTNLKPLSYKPWMAAKSAGLLLLGEKLRDCPDPSKLKCKRSARHSNFPECTKCQRNRAAYQKVMCTPGATRDQRDEVLKAMLDHNKEWHEDRECALKLKYGAYRTDAEGCYECDDKCGSQWVELPVDPQGRKNKSTGTKGQVFPFAIQANVVCGTLNRMTIVPKHITTGTNFGLTCLVMALWRAHEMGRLQGQNSPILYRHTDGGPDNLSFHTHMFHFLCVWLGIFNKLIWFRFDAGHSHTEIADRLFGIMKRLFATDDGSRPEACASFKELHDKMQKQFSKCTERTEMEYLFANWDFDAWYRTASFGCNKAFAGISFDNVFQYEYVGEKLWYHGGVRVTYKERLSTEGTSDDAEWCPIERVVVAGADGQTSHSWNTTTTEGVLFMDGPPDLRHEPPMEDFSDKTTGEDVYKMCNALVDKRDGEPEQLGPEAARHWRALGSVFKEAPRANAMPYLPITRDGESFSGSPRKLLPLLKGLRRFPRPLITWDPFADPPPVCQDVVQVGKPQKSHAVRWSRPGTGASDGAGNSKEHATAPLRDPATVNNVAHAGYTAAARKSARAAMGDEEWASLALSAVERVEKGLLYLVRLGVAEGEFKLGVAEAGDIITRDEGVDSDSDEEAEDVQARCYVQARWYVKSTMAWAWGSTPEFIPYVKANERQVDPVLTGNFLFEIEDGWLTESSKTNVRDGKRDSIVFRSAFMARLRLLASKNPASLLDSNDANEPGARARAGGGRGQGRQAGRGSGARARGRGDGPGGGTENPSEPQTILSNDLSSYVGRYLTERQTRFLSGADLRKDASLVKLLIEMIEKSLSSAGIPVDAATMRMKKPMLEHPAQVTLCIMCTAAKAVLGFASFRMEDPAYLYEVHVSPDARPGTLTKHQPGLGCALLAEFGAQARHAGKKTLRLTVHEKNSRARKIYGILGYEMSPTSPEGADYVIMDMNMA
jgi:ribosomal protein S18 acetylase RimI-like enzyme